MKQWASFYIFVTILVLSALSLSLIFLRLPAQKASSYEALASREFYNSQNTGLSEEQRQAAALKAKGLFIEALRNDPYEAGLWIRLATVQKTLGQTSGASNDTFQDAMRIARILRPDIQSNLDRIISRMNSDTQDRKNDE